MAHRAPAKMTRAERDAYYQKMAEQVDVGSQFELIKPIGSGAYGLVWTAKDLHKTEHGSRGDVAIKQVTGAFERTTDAKRLLREVSILRNLKHSNLLRLSDILVPHVTDPAKFDTVYILTELMDTDLNKIIQSPQPLSEAHIKYFLYQILRGLKYISSAGILHRDMKPGNLLLNENCELKICDFGLARTFDEDDNQEEMTEYVVTRWYRSPEVLLQHKHYTPAVDIWSVGCIFAEMLKREPLFPGRDYIDQIICITNILGTPSKTDAEAVSSKQAAEFLNTLEAKPPKPLDSLFPKATPEALDLLSKMLKFNYWERISVQEALRHPYLKELHEPDEEPVSEKNFSNDLKFDGLNKFQLREKILELILEQHPEHQPLMNQLKKYHVELHEKQAEAKSRRSQIVTRQPETSVSQYTDPGATLGSSEAPPLPPINPMPLSYATQ